MTAIAKLMAELHATPIPTTCVRETSTFRTDEHGIWPAVNKTLSLAITAARKVAGLPIKSVPSEATMEDAVVVHPVMAQVGLSFQQLRDDIDAMKQWVCG